MQLLERFQAQWNKLHGVVGGKVTFECEGGTFEEARDDVAVAYFVTNQVDAGINGMLGKVTQMLLDRLRGVCDVIRSGLAADLDEIYSQSGCQSDTPVEILQHIESLGVYDPLNAAFSRAGCLDGNEFGRATFLESEGW